MIFVYFITIALCVFTIFTYFIFPDLRRKETDMLVCLSFLNMLDASLELVLYMLIIPRFPHLRTIHEFGIQILYILEYGEFGILLITIYRIYKKYVEKYKRLLAYSFIAYGIFASFMLLTNHFTKWLYYIDEHNVYQMGDYYTTIYGPLVLFMLLGVSVLVHQWNRISLSRKCTLLSFMSVPLAGGIINALYDNIFLFRLSIALCGVVLYLGSCYEVRHHASMQKVRLLQLQISLQTAQMNPHFIFNVLTSIRYLMEEDVGQAADVLTHFSNFLRGCIGVTPKDGMSTLQKEIDMAREYLYIEKLRFGNDIEAVFQIEDHQFRVPFLTIEPLVENAIKHGLRKRKGKGTVTVTSWKEGRNHKISVVDDGVGFDLARLSEIENQPGIGIMNVKERIELLCHGSFEIKSEPGIGTEITITIPVKSTLTEAKR